MNNFLKRINVNLALLLILIITFILFFIFLRNHSKIDKGIISENINLKITEKLYPAITGANLISTDSYLKEWINSDRDSDALLNYLKNRSELLGASAIEFAVTDTQISYQYSGREVQMDRSKERDNWYFTLMDSGEDSSFEAYYESITGILFFYYNLVIRNPEGEPLGVIGVMLTYSDLSKALIDYKNLGIVAYLVNSSGEIILHPDQSKIGNIDIYDYYGFLQKSEDSSAEVLTNTDNKNVFKINEINLYLIVEN